MGIVTVLAALAGVAVLVVLQSDEDDDGSLAIASEELTVDGLMSVLLTEEDLPSGFSEESRGEVDDLGDSFLELYEGVPSDCEEAFSNLEEQAEARAEDMRVEAEFTRSSDEAFIRHSMTPVREGDLTMDELLAAYDQCDEPMDVIHEEGSERTIRFEAERLDGLGEDAVALAFFEEGTDLPGTLEIYDITVARGGVYSTVSMAAVDADTEEQQGVDRDLVRDLAEAVDTRIQQGMDEG